jgi:hypothetical protein
MVLRLQIPRAEELPQGVSRCGGWGDGTVMYLSDRHCGELTPHTPHLVQEIDLAPLQRASMLQLVSALSQTSAVAPLSIEFDEAPGAQPLMRVELPDEQRHAVTLYSRLFGLPDPGELGMVSSRQRGGAGAFVAENLAPGQPAFCGWRVWVNCRIQVGEVNR